MIQSSLGLPHLDVSNLFKEIDADNTNKLSYSKPGLVLIFAIMWATYLICWIAITVKKEQSTWCKLRSSGINELRERVSCNTPLVLQETLTILQS